ncbi:cytochrome P450 [Streptomyces sp. NPDC085614]|uniref:cytochrome P450 n=1 Tax=Streptomyces sp. NPDC085614 TaxID=3365733 RepID=UPI0037D6EDF4
MSRRPGVALETPAIDFADPEFQRAPWQTYADLRRRSPRLRAPDGSWYLLGYDDVRFALTSPQLGMDHPFRATRRAFGASMIDQDGEKHRCLRRVTASSFTPRRMEEYQVAIIEPIVNDLLAGMAGKAVDLVGALAAKVPIRVFCRIMGLPLEDADDLYQAIIPLVKHLDVDGVSVGQVTSQRAQLRDYLSQIVSSGRYGDGLVRTFVEAGSDGVITGKDVLNNLMMLLAAGTVTTALSIGNLMTVILRRPGVYEELCADHALIPLAVQEALRLEPPLHVVTRFAVADLELSGAVIPAGMPVHLCLASANRDERNFSRPGDLILGRSGQSLTFGSGPHRCLGFALAVRELETVLKALVTQFPALRLTGTEEPQIQGRIFRGVPALPVHL